MDHSDFNSDDGEIEDEHFIRLIAFIINGTDKDLL